MRNLNGETGERPPSKCTKTESRLHRCRVTPPSPPVGGAEPGRVAAAPPHATSTFTARPRRVYSTGAAVARGGVLLRGEEARRQQAGRSVVGRPLPVRPIIAPTARLGSDGGGRRGPGRWHSRCVDMPSRAHTVLRVGVPNLAVGWGALHFIGWGCAGLPFTALVSPPLTCMPSPSAMFTWLVMACVCDTCQLRCPTYRSWSVFLFLSMSIVSGYP